MLPSIKPGKRFSLLLLEEEECYMDDYVATCSWPSSVEGNWQGLPSLTGRFRLCTKSVFFEPDDTRVPIVRIPVRYIKEASTTGSKGLRISTSQVAKMKGNMEDAPYVIHKGSPSTWTFQFTYTMAQPIASRLQLAIAASKDNTKKLELQAVVKSMEDGAEFDSSRLVSYSEQIKYNGPVAQHTPLLREGGRLVVTDQRLYFQPLHNVSGDVPVRITPLAEVAAVVRRRSSLKPVGMELFFTPPEGGAASAASGPSSVFFSFRSEKEREEALGVITSCHQLGSAVRGFPAALHGMLLEPGSGWLQHVTAAWQVGRVSNLAYLLCLNWVAGRSFNDLAQYPVFPWVLSNYRSPSIDLADPAAYRDLSKPVGALSPDRLQVFLSRYREMPTEDEGGVPPFMYGTHYSTPGYVLYWLVRAAPAHMLRLQAGRFDTPDRLFFSVADAWDSVLSNTSDVKELIPEFYLGDPSFLLNSQRLPLGVRQGGAPVDDVELPPWAEGPAHFLDTCRRALESPHVSAQLHHWVDLVFGVKQRGQAAVEACNVFYHVTYEGAVDSSAMSDHELKALEVQVNEFGQTPQQIFHNPHPQRLVYDQVPGGGQLGGAPSHDSLRGALLSTIAAAAALAEQQQQQQQAEAAGPQPAAAPPRSPARALVAAKVAADAPSSPPAGEVPRAASASPQRHVSLRESAAARPQVDSTADPGACSTSGGQQHTGEVHSWAELPQRLAPLVSRSVQSQPLHCVRVHRGTVYCAGEGGVLRALNLWDLEQIRAVRLPGDLLSLAMLPAPAGSGGGGSGDGALQSMALAGSHNCAVHAYSVESGRLTGSWAAHDDAVACMQLYGMEGGELAAGTRLVTGSWDCSVKVWELGEGRQPWGRMGVLPVVEVKDIDGAVWCAATKATGNMTVVGTEEGVVSAWDMRSQRQLWQTSLCADYVGGLALTPDGNHVVAAAADGNLSLLECRRGGAPLAVAQCAEPLRCCVSDGELAVAGGEAGSAHMWDLLHVLQRQQPHRREGGVVPNSVGLYAPLWHASQAPVSALHVDVVAPGGAEQIACVATVQEDGNVNVFLA